MQVQITYGFEPINYKLLFPKISKPLRRENREDAPNHIFKVSGYTVLSSSNIANKNIASAHPTRNNKKPVNSFALAINIVQ